MSSDLDVLKDIPGYKAILKSVLKSQIQLLIEQLSEQTGEESIILTASINDGTLSHLGSNTGKGFLEGRDEVKSQFLGYCLKSYHKQQQQNQYASHTFETSPVTNSHQVIPPYTRRPPRPMPYNRHPGGKPNTEYYPSKPFKTVQNYPTHIKPLHETAQPTVRQSNDSAGVQNVVKQEPGTETGSGNQTDISFKESEVQDTSGSLMGDHKGSELSQGDFMAASSQRLEQASDTQVKIEAISQEELDLEITGVEPGSFKSGVEPVSFQTNQWESPGHSTMYSQEQQNTGEAPILPATFLEGSVAEFKDKIMKCQYCGKHFLHASWLVRHERKHTGEKPHQCHICHKSFSRKFHLQSHITTVHRDDR